MIFQQNMVKYKEGVRKTMDTKELQEKLILFLDPIGRVLIGEKDEERTNDTDFVVNNPVIIHVEPTNGNISIQFFPVLFKEFLGSKDEKATFTYHKNNIAILDKTVFDFKLYAQYQQMFSNDPAQVAPQSAPQSAPQQAGGEPEVIKLFDD